MTVALLATVVFAPMARANEDPLDPSFGSGGVAVTPMSAGNGVILGLAEDQGNLIAVGQSDAKNFVALRYSSDGSLDPSFSGGHVETAFGDSSSARDVAVQANGRIVVAGVVGDPA